MIKDIKEVIATAKAAGAVIVNDARVTNVSIYPAAVGKNVDYWATITINQAIPGDIAEGKGDNSTHKKGLTTTCTTPLGTLVTCVFDAFLEVNDDKTIVKVNGVEKRFADVCLDLCDYKDIIIADAEKEALSDKGRPYTSHLHKLVNTAKINIVCRDVNKGDKVPSLFSLNAKERVAEYTSVWHDIYGLSGIRPDKAAEALSYALKINDENATDDVAEAKNGAFNAILEMYKKNSNAAAVNAALK